MAILSEDKIIESLTALDGWKLEGKAIAKVFVKKDFVEAMAFVNKVALLAEKADHHPDIEIKWNRVRLVLSTHSEGGVTEKDIDLARKIDML
jgi:4a-hydroxytetrahydrobiopterin dehydratase